MELEPKEHIKRLKVITEGLKKAKGGFPEFRKWILASKSVVNKTGLTRTGLHDLEVKLRKLEVAESPVTGEIEELTDRFVEAYQIYLGQMNDPDHRVNPNQNLFHGCTWYMYFFHYNNHEEVKLARVILKTDGNGKAELENIPDLKGDHYKGEFTLISNRLGIFDLRGREYVGRKLHIQAIVGPSPRDIALGAYVTYEHNTIVSGTLVLELLEDERKHGMSATVLSHKHNPDAFTDVPKYIRRYLARKSKNYLKIPDDVFRIEELRTRMKRYRTNKRTLFFNEDRPIVFISTPVNSIPEEKHKKLVQQVLKIKGQIEQSLPEVSVQYYGEKRRTIVEKTTFLDNLELLKRTQFFVLIHPEPQAVSSAIIEMSWALIYCKAVIIFYKDGTISDLVPDLHNSRRLNYLVTKEINDLELEVDKISKKIIVEIAHQLRTEYE